MRLFTIKRCLTNARHLAVLLTLAAAAPATAQDFRVLDNITDDAGNRYAVWAMAVSDNHKYVTGQAMSMTTGITGIFVYDLETGEYAVKEGVSEMGSDTRGVSDDGLAVGFNPNAVTLAIDGTMTDLETPAGCESGARDVSTDGSVIVGAYWDLETFYEHACVWKDGKMTRLPEPSSEEMGFSVNGTSANFCSEDGSVIVGYIADDHTTRPIIVWRLQDDGTYLCDPVCKEFFGRYEENTDKPYAVFKAANVSRNGKYAAVTVSEDGSVNHMARLDLGTMQLEVFTPDGSGSVETGTGSESGAVADDGTIAGWYQTSMVLAPYSRRACVWYAGTAEPVMLSEEYDYPELDEFDQAGYNLLYDITPDCKRGLGIAYNADYEYVTYVIDFKDNTTGISRTAAVTAGGDEAARYTAEGVRINAPVKGLNIIRKTDGTVVKVMVK